MAENVTEAKDSEENDVESKSKNVSKKGELASSSSVWTQKAMERAAASAPSVQVYLIYNKEILHS